MKTIADVQAELHAANEPLPPVHEVDSFFNSVLGRTLRIHTHDARVFVGQFKCTDAQCNMILALAHEFRVPVAEAAEERIGMTRPAVKLTANESRYVGLICVPGKEIVKVELERLGGM
ncbi:hypothetical protein BT63DRAFT_420010 [Microthyrium microscopicum]|uniref:Sm domain-containing protein n=1 Tax=Microthyrium microscopicum TaxID=703497 RepID=A0A6A6UTG6_9PEZI|nr:hypothetical protein BT63DRAFT_420010 [Microthyrium microscopicum]